MAFTVILMVGKNAINNSSINNKIPTISILKSAIINNSNNKHKYNISNYCNINENNNNNKYATLDDNATAAKGVRKEKNINVDDDESVLLKIMKLLPPPP